MRPLRILVLHSDIAPDAPPDELDTLYQADSIAEALAGRGHAVSSAAYIQDERRLKHMIANHAPDAIFNLVEAIDGSGILAVDVPSVLDRIGVPYTGASYEALAVAGNKPRAKRLMRDAGLPTPDWGEPPLWEGLGADTRLIVKSALEDCSFGLDDGAVVRGVAAAQRRAEFCAGKYGGNWFAESYVEGREFNIAVLQGENGPRVLPLAEMTFQEWQDGRPRIVGYRAKWDDDSFESTRTVRAFGIEDEDPALAGQLRELATRAWNLFGLTGYARVDFRVGDGRGPSILEINPNPCLSPDAGFAAAAELDGMPYPALMEHIVGMAMA